MINKFKALDTKRRILAAVLSLSLVGTGFASLAALNDTLEVQNRYATASVNLTSNGEQTVTNDWPLAFDGSAYAAALPLELTNSGSVELAYGMTSSVTYTPASPNGWSGVAFSIHQVANAAGCTVANATATNQIGGTGSLSTFSLPSGTRTLAAGASETICMKAYAPSTNAFNSDSAIQLLNVNASSTGV